MLQQTCFYNWLIFQYARVFQIMNCLNDFFSETQKKNNAKMLKKQAIFLVKKHCYVRFFCYLCREIYFNNLVSCVTLYFVLHYV